MKELRNTVWSVLNQPWPWQLTSHLPEPDFPWPKSSARGNTANLCLDTVPDLSSRAQESFSAESSSPSQTLPHTHTPSFHGLDMPCQSSCSYDWITPVWRCFPLTFTDTDPHLLLGELQGLKMSCWGWLVYGDENDWFRRAESWFSICFSIPSQRQIFKRRVFSGKEKLFLSSPIPSISPLLHFPPLSSQSGLLLKHVFFLL